MALGGGAIEDTEPAGGEADIELPGLWTPLHHTWVVPGLAALLRFPEGFLDVRGLISCLLCFLTLWVSRARVGSQEQTQAPAAPSLYLAPDSSWLLCFSLDPEGQILYLLTWHLSLLTAHPVVFKALLLLSGLCNCLSGMFSPVMLVACFCLCPSGSLCDCGQPTQTFLMVLPHLPCLLLSGQVSSARTHPASGTGNHWCLESAPLGSVSPQPQKYPKQPRTLVTSLSHTLPQAHLKSYTLHCRVKSQVRCVCALACF